MNRAVLGLCVVVAFAFAGCKERGGTSEVRSSSHAITATQYPLPAPPFPSYLAAGAMAVEDDTIVVSSQKEIYIYVRTGYSWKLQEKLVEPTPQADTTFGEYVALSGDTLVVSNPSYDLSGGKTNAGTVYVFVRSGTNWTLQTKLFASDAKYKTEFGKAVAIDQDTVLVGAVNTAMGVNAIDPGDVYVYVRSGALWSLQQKLPNSKGDQFGDRVYLSGDLAAVMRDSPIAPPEYQIFKRTGTTWAQESSSIVGFPLDLEGSTLVLGDSTVGTVEIYKRQVSLPPNPSVNWIKAQTLIGSSGNEYFGGSASLDGNRLLVGAAGKTGTMGAAYLFEKGTNWTFKLKIVGQDQFFGRFARVSGNVGAVTTDAAYISAIRLAIGEANGTACTTGDICASNFCSYDVCCSMLCLGACNVCSIKAGGTVNGSCSLAGPSRECRASKGVCDKAETCTGTGAACPTDVFQPDNTPCPGGTCQNGVCTTAVDSGVDLPTPQLDSTPPGLEPSTPPGLEPSTPPGLEPSTPPGLEPSTPPGLEPSTPPGLEPSTPPGLEPSTPPQVDAGDTPSGDDDGCQIGAMGTLPGPVAAVPLLGLFVFVLMRRRR